MIVELSFSDSARICAVSTRACVCVACVHVCALCAYAVPCSAFVLKCLRQRAHASVCVCVYICVYVCVCGLYVRSCACGVCVRWRGVRSPHDALTNLSLITCPTGVLS